MRAKVIKKETNKEIPFPKLMETECGLIILFIKKKEGVVVALKQKREYQIGEFYPCWDMEGFTDYNGSILLSNDEE